MRGAERNYDCKCAALVRLAVDTNRTAMQSHQFLNQREPNTCTFMRSAASRSYPVKALEHMRHVLRRNAGPRVPNEQFHVLAGLPQSDFDFSVESELQCVRKKIEDDLLPHLSIHINCLVDGGGVDMKTKSSLLHRRSEHTRELGRIHSEIHRFIDRFHPARFDS